MTSKLSRALRFLALAVAALAIQASSPRAPVAVSGGWTSHGPEGGAFAVFADLRAPGLLYTVTGRGVFLSEDGGASWVSRSEGLVDLPIHLIVGKGDPPVLYGYSYTRFYRSFDGGLTWGTSNASDTVRRPLAGRACSIGRRERGFARFRAPARRLSLR